MYPELPIDERIISKLAGKNNLPLYAVAQVRVNTSGYLTVHNIIPNELSIVENGVLGLSFFRESNVNINYVSRCLEVQDDFYPFETTHILSIPVLILYFD